MTNISEFFLYNHMNDEDKNNYPSGSTLTLEFVTVLYKGTLDGSVEWYPQTSRSQEVQYTINYTTTSTAKALLSSLFLFLTSFVLF